MPHIHSTWPVPVTFSTGARENDPEVGADEEGFEKGEPEGVPVRAVLQIGWARVQQTARRARCRADFVQEASP
ncbi:hypothetical protein Cme02nite_28590 [Catellatospora methionotrophica]|uniref:Uncharacterized protein n=1 Tax=Catellatospora methionotrophica TaxID=121620 RepID=A0A8J3L8Y3_9ACTN|nr:hypothetical protein Cme02nite_28590 [Catellatospora methionotrophica]